MKCLKILLSIFLLFFITVNSIRQDINQGNKLLQKRKNNQVIVEVPPVQETVVNEVSTLVELPVDYHTSISYYYPYFYKAHLITFHDEVDLTTLITTCADPKCSYCSPTASDKCLKCDTGFFLNGTSCDSYCPDGYIADILRSKCILPELVTTEIVYTMAYTVGSCNNMCGHMVHDCSCSPSCKQRGNCCSDYEVSGCDNYFILAARKKTETCEKNQFCEVCSKKILSDGTAQCQQCQQGYFLYGGKCHLACPEGTEPEATNNICKKKDNCNLENCSVCGLNNECKLCSRGYFLHNNQCVELCPIGYRADRITWTCLEPPVFAWYWVFPSRKSCRTHCGIVVSEDWDCSCSADCFRNGNCCQDIENHCEELLFWRKGKLNKKKAENGNKLNQAKQEN